LVASIAAAADAPYTRASQPSALAAHAPLTAIARAGTRLVAAGQRGHILVSDDDGASWKQAAVPVSADLTGISFANTRMGWAVGHEAVVLHTSDGGATWTRQLAGKQAAQLAVAYYTRLGAGFEKPLEQARRMAQGDGSDPFLDVWFEDEQRGWVVGAFNLLLHTEDGGRSWVPWMDRIANPKELHFNSIRGAGGRVFIAGEQGQVWRLDPAAQRFVPAATPYDGSLFALVVEAHEVLALGMRGAVWRSADDGSSWQRVLVVGAAGVTAGASMTDGRIVIVDQAGAAFSSSDEGASFAPVRLHDPMSFAAVAGASNQRLVLLGSAGARVERIDAGTTP
jgi:photosystem II stability/assembly factor-like uncharacterized protein